MAEPRRVIRQGPLIPSEPYRNPEVLLPLVDTLRNVNLYFVFTHGELIPNSGPYRFLTPADTIVIQTGGDETAGCLVSTNLDRRLLPLFQPNTIRETFGFFLGQRGNIRDAILTTMLFNTPAISATDYTLNKRISMAQEDFTPGELWGVFKLEPVSPLRNRIVYQPDLTLHIVNSGGLTEEELILHTRRVRQSPNPSIFFFLNCAAVDKVYDPRTFSGSLQLATRRTQYSRTNTTAQPAGIAITRGGPAWPPRLEEVPELTEAERLRAVNRGYIGPGGPENEVHTFNTLLEAAYPNTNTNTENQGCLGALCRLLKGRRKKKTAGGKRRVKKIHTTRKRNRK